jgi:signal transduction histidine kinase/ligand-binding sensor domain-containing protein/CheY-like chemotaxis protein/AraC-like DNA-binding protein
MIKNLRKLVFLISIIVISFTISKAQSPVIAFQRTDLPENFVGGIAESVLQDYKGYIWIAGRKGLCCIMGNTVRVYNKTNDSTSIPDDEIHSLYEDSQKRLWIGTENGNLALYNRATDNFSRVMLTGIFKKTQIFKFLEIRPSQFYIGNYQGLFLFNEKSKQLKCVIPKISIRDFYRVDDKKVFIATEENAILLFDIEKGSIIKQYKLQLSSNTKTSEIIVFNFSVDKNGILWACTNYGGLFRLNKDKDCFENIPIIVDNKKIQDEIFSIFHDNDNNFWVAGVNIGLLRYDGKSNHFTQYKTDKTNQTGLSSNTISCIIQDKNKNLWISTHRGGVLRFNYGTSLVSQYISGTMNGLFLSNNTVSSFAQAQDKILVGTDGGGLNLMDTTSRSFNYFTTKDGLPDNAVTDIASDKDGSFWVSTWNGGVIHCKVEGNKIIDLHNPIPTESTKGLLYDSKDRLWIASLKSGVTIYDKKTNKLFTKSNKGSFNPSIFIDKQIISYYEVNNGDIWVCSYQGLDRISKMQNVFHYSLPTMYNGNSPYIAVFKVLQTKSKRIWALTSQGMAVLDEKTQQFISCSNAYHLPTSIQSLVESKNGHLWLSSSKGIIDFNPQTGNSEVYNTSYDMHSNAFTERSSFISSNGTIYFGGINGFISFDNSRLKQTKKTTSVEIISLSIFYKRQQPLNGLLDSNISEKKLLKLPYSQSMFSLEYTISEQSSTNKISYRYKLEGFDKDWMYVDDETKASYTNLDPGTYTFKVCASIDQKQWSQARTLQIEIIPPWWKTLAFKIIIILAILLAFRFYFIIRTKAIKRKNAELEIAVKQRTVELTESNALLLESNEEIRLQNERLEELNIEAQRQTEKIVKQQDELIEKKNSLEISNTELLELHKTKDKFFSIIAHDLRNPVGALLNFSELMTTNFDSYKPEKLKTFLGYIHQSSQSIHDLLLNLLDWSRVKNQTMSYKPSQVSLQSIFDTGQKLVMQQMLNKNQKIMLETSDSISVWCDKDMIETVVRNLLSNAVKYSPENGEIRVRTSCDSQTATIQIIDNGVGMDKTTLENIFKTGNESTKGTNNESGTGLGLIICKEFIEKNYGQINVTSEPEKGSCFTIQLPLTKTVKIETIIQTQPIVENATFDFSPLKIKRLLIVDDDEMLRNVLKTIFSSICEIVEASNGEEALAEANKTFPDIIICDIRMPKMDGIEFCKTLKNQRNTCHIPFILLTAENDDQTKIQGLEAKADAYLSKPFNTKMLWAVISNVINSRELLRKQFISEIEFTSSDLTSNQIDAQLIDKLVSFIEENITNGNLSADDLSLEVGMSKSLLYSKLKSITGQSVNEFIRTIRIKRSIKYLIQRKYHINEIADLCGFNSSTYYIRSFNKIYGMTPLEYIEKKLD